MKIATTDQLVTLNRKALAQDFTQTLLLDRIDPEGLHILIPDPTLDGEEPMVHCMVLVKLIKRTDMWRGLLDVENDDFDELPGVPEHSPLIDGFVRSWNATL